MWSPSPLPWPELGRPCAQQVCSTCEQHQAKRLAMHMVDGMPGCRNIEGTGTNVRTEEKASKLVTVAEGHEARYQQQI